MHSPFVHYIPGVPVNTTKSCHDSSSKIKFAIISNCKDHNYTTNPPEMDFKEKADFYKAPICEP
jgi:hypothetical protein